MQAPEDLNATIAALLRDLAAVATTRGAEWGYKGAANAVRYLDRPITDFIQPDGSLAKVPQVGPSSTRVILEVLATGTSPTVERLVAEAPAARAADVLRRRQWRSNFLSRAAVLEVLGTNANRGVRRTIYNGDLQMHSTWSDGADTIAQLAEGCLARGYRYSAITDHSGGLPIAGGLSADRFATQHREIDAANEALDGRFRILKGVEANIGADGSLDVPAAEIARFDVVLAAPTRSFAVTAVADSMRQPTTRSPNSTSAEALVRSSPAVSMAMRKTGPWPIPRSPARCAMGSSATGSPPRSSCARSRSRPSSAVARRPARRWRASRSSARRSW